MAYLNPQYDPTIRADKVVTTNPQQAFVLDPENILSTTATATAVTYLTPIETANYRHIGFQIVADDTTGIEFKVFATLDEDAAQPADGTAFASVGSTWHDVTSDIFGGDVGGATETSVDELEWVDTKQLPLKYMVAYDAVDGSGNAEVFTRRFS